MSSQGWRRFHLAATIAWGLTIIPTILWWHDSILWVAGCSIYANMATHWGAWQASRAEQVAVEANEANVNANEVAIET